LVKRLMVGRRPIASLMTFASVASGRHRATPDPGGQRDGQPPHDDAGGRGREADDDRPAELGDGRRPGGRQVGEGERERPVAGQRVQAGEDQSADAGCQQPGQQHGRGQQATDDGRLEE
jgi:hypothetical protein